MSYHDYGNYKTRWPKAITKEEATEMKTQTENPRIQLISPSKKLYDIQQIIKSLPEEALTIVQLSEAIQKILDGG